MPDYQVVAANGLLDRRHFLRGGAGAAIALGGISSGVADGEELRVEPWMKLPGSPSPWLDSSQHQGGGLRIGLIGLSKAGSPGTKILYSASPDRDWRAI